MGKCHYCSRCGLNMTPSIGRSNKQWLFENKITMCEECNPKLWEVAHDREMTFPKLGYTYIRGKGWDNR